MGDQEDDTTQADTTVDEPSQSEIGQDIQTPMDNDGSAASIQIPES